MAHECIEGETTFYVMEESGECKTWKQPAEKPISKQDRVLYDIGKYDITDSSRFVIKVYGSSHIETFDVMVSKTDSNRTIFLDGCGDYGISFEENGSDWLMCVKGHSVSYCGLHSGEWKKQIPEHIKTLRVSQLWISDAEPITPRVRQDTCYADREGTET
jgi:hypothetical protein